MEEGGEARPPPAPALLDEEALLQEAASYFDVSSPFPHIEAVSTIAPTLSEADYSPHTSESSSHLLDDVEPGCLSLEETAELLHALDATTFFEDTADAKPTALVPAPEPALAPAATALSLALEPPQQQEPPKPKPRPGRKKRPGKPGSAGKMRNPSRERLQNELAYLRTKVVELQSELEGLQQSNAIVQASRNVSPGSRIWKRIAERQAQGRQRSEKENKRLRETLEGQLLLAQRLEQLLRKRPNVAVFSEPSASEATWSPQKRLRLQQEHEDPTATYERFLGELDHVYAQMDSVLEQNGLASSVDDSLRHAYVKTRRGAPGSQDELYAELLDVNLLPFPLERTAAAMWGAVQRQYGKNRYHSYPRVALERPDDTIAVKYRSKCQRDGQEQWLDAILVMRRYVERERLVMVWRSVSRGDDQLAGMYTDETGWSVLKRVPPDAGVSLAGSVMLNCVHVVPKRVDRQAVAPAATRKEEIGLLTNLVIDSYEADVIALSAMLEDLLLQDSLVVTHGA